MKNVAVAAGEAKAAQFCAIAGTAWLVWGVAVGVPASHLLLIGAALIGAAFVLAARRAVKSASGREQTSVASDASLSIQRQFKRINIAQWVAIGSSASLLALMGRGELVAPVVVAIVGIHFFPLGLLFHSRAHMVTGGALVLVACASPFLSPYVENQGGAGIGAGVILLLRSAYSLSGASVGRKKGQGVEARENS